MTEQEIKDFYDTHPDLTLSELSSITGKSIPELKRILLS